MLRTKWFADVVRRTKWMLCVVRSGYCASYEVDDVRRTKWMPFLNYFPRPKLLQVCDSGYVGFDPNPDAIETDACGASAASVPWASASLTGYAAGYDIYCELCPTISVTPTFLMGDDNADTGDMRFRMQFRGATDETSAGISTHYKVCPLLHDGSIWILAGTCGNSNQVSKNFKKAPTWSGSGGATAHYNETSGILKLENRGGYNDDEAMSVELTGPGTLYPTHVDLEPEADYLQVADDDGNVVQLTGNYSACLDTRTSLESIYMDKNLAPGSAEGGSGQGVTRTSTHQTEETQNHQDGLCHNILTGKVLPPAPIGIAGGTTTTLQWASDGSNGGTYYEGFTLYMLYDDLYTGDVTVTAASGATHISVVSDECESFEDAIQVSISGRDWVQASASGTPPDTAAGDAYFVDTDTRKRWITTGKVYVTPEAPAPAAYKITLEKHKPAGTWGFMLHDDSTIFGPRDTWGHKSAELPHYDSGGSTATDAPTQQVEYGGSYGYNEQQGQLTSSGESIVYPAGGGPPGARVFNKHGDVIGSSARGEHFDYQHTTTTDVESWYCTSTGSGVQACDISHVQQLLPSQGSPPSPTYQLRVRSCSAYDSGADPAAWDHCNYRDGVLLHLIDIGMRENSAIFYDDFDPKNRVIQGEITVRTNGMGSAMGLKVTREQNDLERQFYTQHRSPVRSSVPAHPQGQHRLCRSNDAHPQCCTPPMMHTPNDAHAQ